MPITTEEFLQNFVTYNEGVWPAQVVLVLMAVPAVGLTFAKTRRGDRLTGWILGLFWLWTGLVYHLTFFRLINPAAWLFGAAAALQGIAFLWAVGVKQNLSFTWRNTPTFWVGLAFVAYALIIYPLFGYLVGHIYPQQPTFGAPCPTTIFTFGLLLWGLGRARVGLAIIPFLWSLVGGSAAFAFGIVEDYGLIVAGLLGFGIIMYQRKRPVEQETQHAEGSASR